VDGRDKPGHDVESAFVITHVGIDGYFLKVVLNSQISYRCYASARWKVLCTLRHEMEAYRLVLLGIMVTWTPSLVVLALMLRGQHSKRRV